MNKPTKVDKSNISRERDTNPPDENVKKLKIVGKLNMFSGMKEF